MRLNFKEEYPYQKESKLEKWIYLSAGLVLLFMGIVGLVGCIQDKVILGIIFFLIMIFLGIGGLIKWARKQVENMEL